MSSSKIRSRLSGLSLVAAVLLGVCPCPALADVYNPAYERGLAEMGRRDYDGAVNSFGESLGFSQTDGKSFFHRGQCFFQMGQYQTALEDFEHLQQLEPNNVDALLWAGTAQAKLGKDDAATASYLKAMRLNPDLVKAYEKGTAGGTGSDGAAGQAKKGRDPVNIKPGNIGAVQSYERAVAIYQREGNKDIARDEAQDKLKSDLQSETRIDELNEAIRQDPTNADNYFRRGRYYYRLQKYPRAINDYNDAIKLSPMKSQFYLARARVYHDRNQPDLCNADIKAAQNVDPTVSRNFSFADR